MAEETIVNRREFEDKLDEYLVQHPENNESMWNKKQERKVIKLLEEMENPNVKKTNSHYHFNKYYELIKIGSDTRVIIKRLDESKPLIFIVAIEDLFDKLMEAHIQSRHGGRDKMLYYAKTK